MGDQKIAQVSVSNKVRKEIIRDSSISDNLYKSEDIVINLNTIVINTKKFVSYLLPEAL